MQSQTSMEIHLKVSTEEWICTFQFSTSLVQCRLHPCFTISMHLDVILLTIKIHCNLPFLNKFSVQYKFSVQRCKSFFVTSLQVLLCVTYRPFRSNSPFALTSPPFRCKFSSALQTSLCVTSFPFITAIPVDCKSAVCYNSFLAVTFPPSRCYSFFAFHLVLFVKTCPVITTNWSLALQRFQVVTAPIFRCSSSFNDAVLLQYNFSYSLPLVFPLRNKYYPFVASCTLQLVLLSLQILLRVATPLCRNNSSSP